MNKNYILIPSVDLDSGDFISYEEFKKESV